MAGGSKPRIAIVAGEQPLPRLLRLFEPLRDEFEPTIYALHNNRLIDRHGTGIKLRIFENIPDMPGYLSGLEEELAQASAIIGVETSRLATFQAVRASRKFGVPLGVLVTEWRPFFYERYANIRAIQFDITNKTDRFFATSQAAAQSLKLDQVPEASIKVLPPVVDNKRFKPDAAGRARFRKYIGIGEDEFVVLFQQDLEMGFRPEIALQAMALLQSRGAGRGRGMRILFAGNGRAAMDLKYQSFDLGLGKNAMFLHQDAEPFLSDLYAAVDAFIVPRATGLDFHEDLPLAMLEAMAAGATPLVGAGTVAAEFAGEASAVFGDDTHQALAAALTPLANDRAHLEAMSRRAVRKVALDHTLEALRETVLDEIRRLVAARVSRVDVTEGVPEFMREAEAAFERGEPRDALVRCEEMIMMKIPSTIDRAAILCLKGQAHYAMGDIEAASFAYTESIKLNDRDSRCLRGLGYVAWQGHSNEEALMFFKKAHAQKDDDLQVMLGLGLIYRRLGLLEEAIFWLEKCIASDGYPDAAISALAQACSQVARPEFGIAVLERALEGVGNHRVLMMTLGQLYLNHGRASEGHAMLEQALSGASDRKVS